MPPPESDIRTGVRIGHPNRTSETDSHERTNERTNGEDSYVTDKSSLTETRAHVQGFDTFGMARLDAVLHEVVDRIEASYLKTRWEVTRRGDRDEIPRHVRLAVWFRDGGRCVECRHNGWERPTDDGFEIDHIRPWSAGGSDETTNLRLLCVDHNQRRSNFVDLAKPARPATWWCHRCYSRDGFGWEYRSGLAVCPQHRDYQGTGGRCRVARAYYRARQEGTYERWHERAPLVDLAHIAYCAHCDTVGSTEVVL